MRRAMRVKIGLLSAYVAAIVAVGFLAPWVAVVMGVSLGVAAAVVALPAVTAITIHGAGYQYRDGRPPRR